ncbi:MAG: hypothetical protein ACJAWS_000669 [Oleiphilaceae bacterium]|jgi:hypothetical protein
MQISQQAYSPNIEKVRIDFMDVYHDMHQNEETNKKKNKNKRSIDARRGIEDYLENKRLKANLKDWWDEI